MFAVSHIFLIDDDEDDRWLFTEALARSVPGIQCTTAAGGSLALEMLEVLHHLPDIIFMDLNMPGMDGKRCLEQLKSNDKLKSIPVIVYSTSNYHRDVQETLQMGALRFVMKPSGYTQLCDMFKTMFTLPGNSNS